MHAFVCACMCVNDLLILALIIVTQGLKFGESLNSLPFQVFTGLATIA